VRVESGQIVVDPPSEPVQQFSLTINCSPVAGGSISGAGQYTPGTVVNVSASPSAGYHFVNWTRSGEIIGTQASFGYVMPSANVTLIANFEAIPPQTVIITVQCDPVSGGEVKINSGSWGSNLSVTVNGGTAVTLEAKEKSGYNWDGWYDGSIRVSFNKVFQVTANANKTYKAKFSLLPPGTTYTLSLRADPVTGASVSGGGAYRAGAMMTIRANITQGGYQFWAWTQNGVPISYLSEDVYIMPSEDVTLVAEIHRVKPYGMVAVQRGIFQMGGEEIKPVHTVRIMYNYWIGKYPVTFSEYDAFCWDQKKTKPSDNGWGRSMRPVISVSWNDAIAYCNWLSEREGLQPAYNSSGKLLDKTGQVTTDITQVEGYRLPTEAEWEYAARGGHRMTTPSSLYAGSNDIDSVAWYSENSNPDGSGKKTQPVGLKSSNEIGLFDMSGNVREMCYDWYEKYPSDPQTNPIGPETGSYHLYRSGCWDDSASYCRVLYRYNYWYSTSTRIGFRVARTSF